MAERSLPTLPDEVIIDCIMVRVPDKTVGRFRCVSKPWCSLLSSPHFAQAHLNIHKHEPEGILLSLDSPEFSFCTVNIANDSSVVSRRFNYPSSNGYQYARLEGSCNGLVLLKERIVGDSWILYLFNHITLEYLKIPESSDGFYCHRGLGYDSLHDDYKIVSIAKTEPYYMGIYSVKMGTWRSLGNSPFQVSQYFQHAGLFVNGSIHWLADVSDRGGDVVLAAFSLTREKFTEVPLPKGFIYNSCFKFIVVGGCIAMIVPYCEKGIIKLWVMKDYGVQDSWTGYDITTTEKHIFGYVGVLEEDEIVFMKLGRKLVSYNWITGIWRDLVHAGKPGIGCLDITETSCFIESLISPNYGHKEP